MFNTISFFDNYELIINIFNDICLGLDFENLF